MKLIVVGKTRETFLREGIAEYAKRISRFTNLQTVEIKDSNIEDEGEKILKAVGSDYAVVLSVDGKAFSSEELASLIKKNMDRRIAFVIGGPDGLSEKVLDRADVRLSLSKMTLTHEMSRLFLIEQIYRSLTIINGGKYHK